MSCLERCDVRRDRSTYLSMRIDEKEEVEKGTRERSSEEERVEERVKRRPR